MSTNYSTIQQHQPLRVPEGWVKQERALIVQLDEIFDDIYRRFGRLRLEDMGDKLKQWFSDADGNFTQLETDVSGLTVRVGNAEGDITSLNLSVDGLSLRVGTAEGDISALSLTVDGLSVTVGNKYDKISGITISSSGIDISGSQYVKIASGGYFQVTSGNFGIDSSSSDYVVWSGAATGANGSFSIKKDGTLYSTKGTIGGFDIGSTKLSSGSGSSYVALDSSGTYALWAGAESASSAPFKVKNSGEVYFTKLIIQKETSSGGSSSYTTEELDLTSNSNRLRGGTILGWTQAGNSTTLYTTYGDLTFSRATSLSGAWSGGVFTATATPQGETLATSVTVGAATWDGNTATVPVKATIGSSATLYDVRDVTVNATVRYNAGWDYGITQRVVSAQAAGSSEIPIKILTYDEKWKINFTIPDSSGVNQVSSYIVQAPSGSTPTTVNVVTAGWQDVGGTRPNITFSPDGGSGSSKSIYLQVVYVPGTEACDFTINSSYDNSSFSEIKRIYTKLKKGSWSNNKMTVTMTNTAETHTYTTTEVDASSIYSAGQSAAGLRLDASTHKVIRDTSNSTKEYTVSVSVGSWSGGNATVAAVLGNTQMQTATVSIPAASSWSAAYIGVQAGDPKMSVSVSIGGASRTGTVSAAGAYNAGWNACIDAMGLYQSGGVYYFYKYVNSTYLYPAPMTPSGQGQWYNIAAGYGTISKK